MSKQRTDKMVPWLAPISLSVSSRWLWSALWSDQLTVWQENELSVALYSNGTHELVVVLDSFHTYQCQRGCFISTVSNFPVWPPDVLVVWNYQQNSTRDAEQHEIIRWGRISIKCVKRKLSFTDVANGLADVLAGWWQRNKDIFLVSRNVLDNIDRTTTK